MNSQIQLLKCMMQDVRIETLQGLEGLTKHLTTVLFVDGEAVSQDSARGVAESFEKYLKE